MPKAVLVANTDWYLYNFRLPLARALRSRSFEVILVSPAAQYALKFQEEGFPWRAWNVGRKTLSPLTELAAFNRLRQIYRQEKPDLVHHFTIKPVIYGSMAARLAGVRAVVNSITGLGYVFLRQDARARLLQAVVKRLYRFTFNSPRGARVAAIFENETNRDFFIHEGLVSDRNAFLVESVGVDPDWFSPAPEPEGPLIVVLPARMLWDKGVGILVDAAREIRRAGTGSQQARFVLVGEPDPGNPATIDRNILQGWVDEGAVEWWGWQQDMRQVYHGSHVIVLPSSGEGVPTCLLEAAACARPIVATDVPGCRDVVNDGVNGYLVPLNDPAALARAVTTLLKDSALRGRMGAAGRALVLEKFTNQKVIAANMEIYDALLATTH